MVVVSHFHADHCFGWPFLLDAAAEGAGGRTLHVVGPPGIEAHLATCPRCASNNAKISGGDEMVLESITYAAPAPRPV